MFEEMIMPRLTIYLDENTQHKVKLAAQQASLSQSKWISKLIQEKVITDWPEEIMNLAGTWKDFPNIKELRRDLGQDIAREKF